MKELNVSTIDFLIVVELFSVSRSFLNKLSITAIFRSAKVCDAWLLQFSEGLKLLGDYDHEQLDKACKHTKKINYPAKEEYMTIVESMRTEFNTAVFGKLKDKGFDSAIAQIEQAFGKRDIYPRIEEKAAMLL